MAGKGRVGRESSHAEDVRLLLFLYVKLLLRTLGLHRTTFEKHSSDGLSLGPALIPPPPRNKTIRTGTFEGTRGDAIYL